VPAPPPFFNYQTNRLLMPSIPRVADHPKYVAAAGTRDRLAGEVARLEREQSDLQARAAEQREQRAKTARRLVAGEPLAAVRERPQDAAILRVSIDLRNARAGLALADEELARTATAVAADLGKEFFPHYREQVRRHAAAWLAFVKESHSLADLDVQLDALHGRGGCENPVPRAGAGDPASQDSVSAVVLRQLLDGGFLDARADAEHLRGFAVRPPSK
jgi:hypothetical protein